MTLTFSPRSELTAVQWDDEKKAWKRPPLDGGILRELSERSTANGLLRVGLFVAFLSASAVVTVLLARIHLLLAVPALYLYYFFYGFWVGIGHELQHRTVFARSFDWFSEIFFSFVQTIMWNSPRYARISHKLHHRYTMVREIDPETQWPEVITSSWLRKFLINIILKILVVGAVVELYKSVAVQVRRIAGKKDRMMREHCSERDVAVIRIESAGILLIHLAVAASAVVFKRWELLAFVTIAWQIGAPIEVLWHATEHIGRLYNVNDHRLNTRSVRVSRFVKLIFWGLDDHVDHHLYPGVPSRNLPKLHRILQDELPEPRTMIECWKEMFAVAREKDEYPEHEYVPEAAR
jgi:fatty acid desaturase